MCDSERLKKKLHTAFKLSGFSVRREFCSLILEKFNDEKIDLDDGFVFDTYVKNLCNNLEKQCLSERSIERDDIEQAIEVCLYSGCDKTETTFTIISAFNFPKLIYDPERRLYLPCKEKSKFLALSRCKTQLFLDRYYSILQRVTRNFKNKVVENANNRPVLETIDHLLTSTCVTLDRVLVLGSILQVSEGKYYLEDPSGMIELNLSHCEYHGGFFVENCFVLVNGYYDDKVLNVSTMILPPGEEHKESRIMFGNVNYFGGSSPTPLRDSRNLQEKLFQNAQGMILFFSDVWLDNAMTLEKLQVLFNGMENSPPIAFVFMGNFMEEPNCAEKIGTLKKLFKQFGELMFDYPDLVKNSEFVFVPGMLDPCSPHIVPQLPLPTSITEDFKKFVPNAIFTTNPCRLQYCNREIVIFRADVSVKLMQGTLCKPESELISESITRTILSQGHLSPLSLNALTVHWDLDYTLRLYPLPNLIVLGDKADAYKGQYKGCQVVNPGSFCESGFQFQTYTPYTDELDDCVL